ncbi:hypothetical protein F0562_025691 [Nyssa sinensis]|uniref:Disease resistance N-terminal domain-containing protein n=1 Tax=Nyssa sinensis TaxID=561372 RepID=A0A5J5B8H3_9ASTE|nr:hypothetical protein F0562_025691 [Nyssa sinensis]
MAVGEIFLSAFITLLFDKLLSHELMKHARREGLHASIKKLENTLREIKKVVKDAEEKQISDEDVKLWLEELRDLAYDADDILDEFATEALRRALMAEPQSSTIDKEVEPFTRLINLRIHGCSKLLGKLPKHLPSLKELVIEECPQLVVALLSLGMLRETRNSADLSLLTCLSITDVPIPVSFCNPDIADEVLLANVATNHLKSLTRLHVNNISKLTTLPLWFIQGLTGLEELNIIRCGELASLWQNEVQLQLYLPALRHLVIKNCPQLFCLFDEKDEEEEGAGGGGQREGLPCMRMLEYLEIHDCGKLEKLPQDLHTLTFLGELTIDNCPRLISFPKTGLPSTLRTLTISKCRALETLTEVLMHNNRIEVLDVSDCPSLTSLSSRTALPATLKVLRIIHCKNLESIVVEGLQTNSALDSVRIWDCKNLKSLPDGPHNLSQLVISDCDNLEFLSEGWLSTTSLRKLQIVNCKKLEALPNRSHNLTSLQHLRLGGFPGAISYFRQRNFPTNLNSLIIDKLPCPSEWGLHRFSCLRALRIWGSCLDLLSFPDKEGGILLPSSLTELHITDFPNLECLSSEFQDLISLENLTISDCPKLASLPDQGLPRSLLELQISQCPLLRQRYQKSRGQCWPMIAQIPCVYI